MLEFFGVPVFAVDFYAMLLRFAFNLLFISIIIRGLYLKSSTNKVYAFTFFMVGIVVFFLCFTLKKYDLDLGMALGLFAIFGVIHYRTNTINIKEMTYLFVVIGISVINALASKDISYAETLACNLVVVTAIYLIEKTFFGKKEQSKNINYEKIENIKPENHELLKADLEERTGLKINRVVVKDINFLDDTTKIVIYYDELPE